MTNDVAIFLDLDNLVISAKQINLTFDINLILDRVKEITHGRIVLRRSYGDWRQNQKLLKDLATAGFVTQSTVVINDFGKNLADMQIIVDTMDTLVDGHQYSTYVLVTGDRDFTPLVQSLRKRGKQVIGVGIKHTASRSLVSLCDHYIYYEDIAPSAKLTHSQVKELLERALNELLKEENRVRASILKQRLIDLSSGAFDNTPHADGSFRKFLIRYPSLITLQQEGTTTYVTRSQKHKPSRPLHLCYRTGLKKQKLRVVVPAEARLAILKSLIQTLQQDEEYRWRQLIDLLVEQYRDTELKISKNMINAVMLVARRAKVIRTIKGRSLATAPVLLELEGEKPVREAIVRCDATYLREMLALPEPFDIKEAALALYEVDKYSGYLQMVMSNYSQNGLSNLP